MAKKVRLLLKRSTSEEGQAAVEYALIISVVVLVALVGVAGLGAVVEDMYNNTIWGSLSAALGP